MVQAAEAERELRLTQNKSKVWFELVTIPRNRRALVYGIVMITLGQLTGINAVMYYLSTLMGRIGFSTKNSVFMSLVGGGSLLIGTIPAILYMDKFGRRVWGTTLLGSSLGWCWLVLDTRLTLKQTWLLPKVSISLVLFCTWAFRVVRLFDMGCARRVVFVGDQITRYDYLLGIVVLVGVHCHIQLQQNEGGHDIQGLTIGFYGGIAFLGFFYQVLFMPETKGRLWKRLTRYSRSHPDSSSRRIFRG